MRDDAPRPASVPKKRKQIEDALDRWIAEWLAGDELTPSERRRLAAEKARRKALEPDHRVGVLVGPEGVTPEQRDVLVSVLRDVQFPTEIHHPGLSSPLHQACKRIAPVVVHDGFGGMREVVKASDAVVGAVRTPSPEGTPVWEAVRYAKHRRLPATVILPDGQLHVGEANG